MTNLKTKCGFVALIGATNSGKSTLLNTILSKKVSITSHKVQTTRNQIRGIKTDKNTQMIFVDTPGIFTPRGGFDKAMISSAWAAMNDSDAVVFMLDVKKGITKTFDNIIKHLKTINTPISLCLNKVDLIEKRELLNLTQKIVEKTPDLFENIFMISATQNDGVSDLVSWIEGKMPEAPFYFDEDSNLDVPLMLHLSELTREKVYEYLHQELPYAIAVQTEEYKEKPAEGKKPASVDIKQVIYTNQASHKSIILGEKGTKIKAIGIKARQDMEEMLGCKVNLFLFVKVKKNWRESAEFFTDIGLEFKK